MFTRKNLFYVGVLCLLFCITGLSFAQAAPQPVRDAITDLNRRLGTNYTPLSFNWTWGQNGYNSTALGCTRFESGATQGTVIGYQVEFTVDGLNYDYRIAYDPDIFIMCAPLPTPTPTPLPPTFTYTPAPSSTPFLSPTPSSTPSSCDGISPRLVIGELARVTPGIPNNIREIPTAGGHYLGEIPGEGVFTVLDGPRCSRDGTWWFVDYQGVRGWTLEGNQTDYYVEPMSIVAPTATPFVPPTVPTALPTFTPTFAPTPTPTEVVCVPDLPSRLVIGEPARITPGIPNNVREQPGTSGRYLGEIPAEGVFTVLEGPVCGSGFAWWRVDYQGLIGWTPEGQPGDYWMEPLNIPIHFSNVTQLQQIAAWNLDANNVPSQLHFASDTALYVQAATTWRAWDSPQQNAPVAQRTWQEVPPLTEGLLRREQLNILTDANGVQINDLNGQPVSTLPPEANSVLSAISPDGRFYAQGSEFAAVLWHIDPASPQTETGQTAGRGHTTSITNIFFSPDSRYLATQSQTETYVTNLTNGTVATITQGSTSEGEVVFSADGTVLVFSALETDANGSQSNIISRYESNTGSLINSFTARMGAIARGITLSPDNELMALYSVSTLPGSEGLRSSSVTLWDVVNGQELYGVPRTGGQIAQIAFNPAGTVLAIADADGNIELWGVGS